MINYDTTKTPLQNLNDYANELAGIKEGLADAMQHFENNNPNYYALRDIQDQIERAYDDLEEFISEIDPAQ